MKTGTKVLALAISAYIVIGSLNEYYAGVGIAITIVVFSYAYGIWAERNDPDWTREDKPLLVTKQIGENVFETRFAGEPLLHNVTIYGTEYQFPIDCTWVDPKTGKEVHKIQITFLTQFGPSYYYAWIDSTDHIDKFDKIRPLFYTPY